MAHRRARTDLEDGDEIMNTETLSDQERLDFDEELKALIGENLAGYEHVMRDPADIKKLPRDEQKIEQRKRLKFGQGAWLGLLLPISFFWYRKLWLDGVLITVGWVGFAILLGMFIPFFDEGPGARAMNTTFGVMTVLLGKEFVMWRYRKIVAKYRTLYPDREDRLQRLTQRGGTSKLGGIAPYALIVLIGAAFLLAM